jgi:prolyl-tRNA synthetase
MRYSQLFSKSSKNRPGDADSVNARYLVQGGFVHQEMAGVYSWLPLGLRVLRNVEKIVREEMNALGGQEILMTALQPKENWQKTNRWDSVDVLFKVPSQTGKEYGLGPTAEELVTPLVQATTTFHLLIIKSKQSSVTNSVQRAVCSVVASFS